MDIRCFLTGIVLSFFISVEGLSANYEMIVENELNLDSLNLTSDVMEFRDDYIKNQIMSYEKDVGYYNSNESFVNIVTLSFTKWCKKFFHKKYDFVVFRLPIDNVVDRDLDVWSARGEAPNCFESHGSQICFDPHYDEISLNKYLLANKIVVVIRSYSLDSDTKIMLDAILPHNGKYYHYKDELYFVEKVAPRYFNKKDADKGRKIIGDGIGHYIDNNGWLDFTFFVHYFRWTLNSMSVHKIQKVDLNPERDDITIKSFLW